jgi:kynurenine formamidase
MNPQLPRSPQNWQVLPGWQVVDLSHSLHPQIPLWSSDPTLQICPWATYEREGYFINQIVMGEHSGTHWGTPNTFIAGGLSADQFAANKLILTAVMIDMRTQADCNPDYCLSCADLAAWEKGHGPVPTQSLVILFTGWQERWTDPAAFWNRDAQGTAHFPGYSPEVAHFLVHQRQAIALGTDTHGVDAGQDQTYAASSILYQANGMVLECLAGLDQLPPQGAIVFVGGLPIRGGSGSPARVLALVPQR